MEAVYEEESKVIKIWGYMPDADEGEDVFRFPEFYKDGDRGKCKAMIWLKGELPDGTPSSFFIMLADKNDSGEFVKVLCSSSVNSRLKQRAETDTEFTVPFKFVVQKGTTDNGEYTTIKMKG